MKSKFDVWVVINGIKTFHFNTDKIHYLKVEVNDVEGKLVNEKGMNLKEFNKIFKVKKRG